MLSTDNHETGLKIQLKLNIAHTPNIVRFMIKSGELVSLFAAPVKGQLADTHLQVYYRKLQTHYRHTIFAYKTDRTCTAAGILQVVGIAAYYVNNKQTHSNKPKFLTISKNKLPHWMATKYTAYCQISVASAVERYEESTAQYF